MPSMSGLLCKSYTVEQFVTYVKDELSLKMGTWRPTGLVLHNTGKMVFPGFDAHGVQITPAQRITNMSVDWVARHFNGGPHFLVSPAYHDVARNVDMPAMIHTVWPGWLPGTHSPSWNSTFWGMEMVGDFDLQPFPDDMKNVAVKSIRALYDMLGHVASDSTFHLHKEDPRTTHKHCPGVNAGNKQSWLDNINDSGHDQTVKVWPAVGTNPVQVPKPPQELPHVSMGFTPAMEATLKKMEGFRSAAYDLNGIWHVGYGFRDGFKGMKIDGATTMTLAAADALFQTSMNELSDTILSSILKVKPTQNQLDALGIFAWNVGTGALAGSSIALKLNAGDVQGAAAAFLMWDKWRPAGPGTPLEVSPQLHNRRVQEQGIFLGKINLPL